ncbi:MAG TPA: DUF72 domain-containing protein [Verrucomicrobiae bacterium]|jgi:uncharacterized protein YecE (DUF72 family)|nr:DUF72 domain-containing protein [Verrucomicrobiae bacterium]
MTVINSKSKTIKRLSTSEWRARKLERREKQRQANVGRASKMRAARLASGLPSPPVEELPKFNVGCSGWFYWHWRELFYPRGIPTKDWFAYYRMRFPTVEINASFYSWPTVNTVKTWARQAGNRNFIYTVKVCELITHVKRFSRTRALVKDFSFIADLLESHMGCFLFQLPPSFRYTPSRLKRILAQLDSARRNVVEFRHRSWWNPKVYAAFKKARVIFCSCSAPNLPDELIAASDEVYIRFHGLTKWYRHNYSPAELAVWVERIKASGCKRVWAYFNNDRDAYAIKNAKELTRQLKRAFVGRSA